MTYQGDDGASSPDVDQCTQPRVDAHYRPDPQWWPAVAAVLSRSGEPWPPDACRHDLEWWAHMRKSHSISTPGRPALRARWKLTDHAVRTALREFGSSPSREHRGSDIVAPHTAGGHVYAAEAVGCDRVKIGYTGSSVALRVGSFATGCPFPLRVIAVWPGTPSDEAEIHRRFAGLRIVGEWFHMNDELRSHVARLAARAAT